MNKGCWTPKWYKKSINTNANDDPKHPQKHILEIPIFDAYLPLIIFPEKYPIPVKASQLLNSVDETPILSNSYGIKLKHEKNIDVWIAPNDVKLKKTLFVITW